MLARPRRSVLYMPGSNAKALAKAADPAGGRADPGPRRFGRAGRQGDGAQTGDGGGGKGDFGGREVVIRVNGPHTPWGPTDLVAAAAAGPDAILLPKVDGPGAVMLAARMHARQRRA